MAVPAGVGAAFEVVEAEAGFEFWVVVFDAPADLGQADEFGQGNVVVEVGEPVVGGFGGVVGPLGEQPTGGQVFKAGSSPACSRRYAATQFPSVPSPMPSSRATAAIGRDPSITSFTASSRNCGEKFLFARGNCFPLQIDQFYLVHLSGKTVAAHVVGAGDVAVGGTDFDGQEPGGHRRGGVGGAGAGAVPPGDLHAGVGAGCERQVAQVRRVLAVTRPGWTPVGAENGVALCDLGVLVDQATEPVASQDAHVVAWRRWFGPRLGRSLL